MLHALVGLPRSRRHERQREHRFRMLQAHLEGNVTSTEAMSPVRGAIEQIWITSAMVGIAVTGSLLVTR